MINIFICYAKEHRNICDDLKYHLSIEKKINITFDADIKSGDDWDKWIKSEINNADIIILLLSKEYLSKDYAHDKEIGYVEERKEQATIMPFLVNDCLWEKFEIFRKIAIYPPKNKTLYSIDEKEREKCIKEFASQVLKKSSNPDNKITIENGSIKNNEDENNIHIARQLGIIAINPGGAIIEELPEQIYLFYKFVAEIITKKHCELIQQEFNALPIGLVEGENQNSGDFNIAQKIIDYFDLNILPHANPIDVLMVDYCSLYNDTPPPSERIILYALTELLFNKKIKTLINILPDVWVIDDIYRTRIMAEHLDSGNLILVDKKGCVVNKNTDSCFIDKNQYHLKRNHAFNNSLKMLQTKMIRRIGHYQGGLIDGIEYCNNYFYDGEQCENELYDLIKQYITERYRVEDLLIIYNTQISDWIQNPIYSLRDDPGVNVIKFDNYFSNNYNKLKRHFENALIVLPFFHNGESSKKIIDHIEQKGIKRINILSIIKDDDIEYDNIHSDFIYKKKKYSVYSFIGRKRGQIKKSDCALCKIGAEYNHKSYDVYQMLTAHAMWSMANEFPWKDEEEQEVTPNRKQLHYIPDFYSIIHSNGAWLSSKIRSLMDSHIIEKEGVYRFPQWPYLILCPNEKGANALADHLNVIQGYNVVGIPKDVINNIINENWSEREFTVNMRKNDGDEWYMQLKTANKDIYAFILEEFCVRGKTKDALIKISKFFGIYPICHIAMFNFNIINKLYNNKEEYPTRSLYEFEINPMDYSAK